MRQRTGLSTETRSALLYAAIVLVAAVIIAMGASWGWSLGDDPDQAELDAAATHFQQLQQQSADPLADPAFYPRFPVHNLYPDPSPGARPLPFECDRDAVRVWDDRTQSHTACVPIEDFLEWYRLNERDRTYFSEILSQGPFEGIKNCPRSLCR